MASSKNSKNKKKKFKTLLPEEKKRIRERKYHKKPIDIEDREWRCTDGGYMWAG
jgi:hypothetical protein